MLYPITTHSHSPLLSNPKSTPDVLDAVILICFLLLDLLHNHFVIFLTSYTLFK